MHEIEEGAWLGADENHLEWTTRVHGGEDGTVLSRWTHSSREAAEAEAAREAASNRDMMRTGAMVDDGSEIDTAWRRVGPWCTGDQIPVGDATNHDRLPAHIFNAALMAAFPGLPATMTLDQAGDVLIDMIVRTSNGRFTAAEALGHREFVMTKLYRSA